MTHNATGFQTTLSGQNSPIHSLPFSQRYEGCSNMNASSFITFLTYILRQNGKRFYKGLYVTFKLAPDLKKNTVYLSSYSPWMRVTLVYYRTYTSDIDERIILRLTGDISWNFLGTIPIFLYNDSVKVVKIRHVFIKLYRIVFTKVSLCLQINGKQNNTFQFSAKLILNKMHETSFKLVLTQRQFVDRSYWVAATNCWWIVGNF